jgi:hypothetical protein
MGVRLGVGEGVVWLERCLGGADGAGLGDGADPFLVPGAGFSHDGVMFGMDLGLAAACGRDGPVQATNGALSFAVGGRSPIPDPLPELTPSGPASGALRTRNQERAQPNAAPQ